MKSGSNFSITFEGVILLGRYSRAGRTGIIEGETMSFPENNQITEEAVISAAAPTLYDGGNRARSLDFTTVEYFDTPTEAQDALVAHESTWAALPRTGTLTLEGIGTWQAAVRTRTPSLTRGNVLQVSYSIVCGKRLP